MLQSEPTPIVRRSRQFRSHTPIVERKRRDEAESKRLNELLPRLSHEQVDIAADDVAEIADEASDNAEDGDEIEGEGNGDDAGTCDDEQEGDGIGEDADMSADEHDGGEAIEGRRDEPDIIAAAVVLDDNRAEGEVPHRDPEPNGSNEQDDKNQDIDPDSIRKQAVPHDVRVQIMMLHARQMSQRAIAVLPLSLLGKRGERREKRRKRDGRSGLFIHEREAKRTKPETKGREKTEGDEESRDKNNEQEQEPKRTSAQSARKGE